MVDSYNVPGEPGSEDDFSDRDNVLDWKDGEEQEKRSFFSRFRRKKKVEQEPVVMNGSGGDKRRISLQEPHSYVAEQFRSLRARIDALSSAQRPIRTVALTSANPGEGKSMSSVNLAYVSAMSVGRRVLLVDCDMRRPAIADTLGLQPSAGIAEVLRGEATFDDATMSIEGSDLDVICVRGQPGNPSELLASERMRALIEEASKRYDRVILDTPIALDLPDAKTVSDLCDGSVVVARAGVTVLEDIEAVLDLLDRERVLGVVLNAIDAKGTTYGD